MTQDNLVLGVQPGGRLTGSTRVPGDKSMSHRSIMLASLANGVTHITGFLEGDDSLATLRALRALGVHIEGPYNGSVSVTGVGKYGLQQPAEAIDLGNSGTSLRLLSGILAAQPFATVCLGDASLSKRPMGRVVDPLSKMGARIQMTPAGTAPLHISPTPALQGIHYAMPVASAQVKSSLLLAGLYADGTTSVVEPAVTRDHTERMLAAFSYPISHQGATVTINNSGELKACNLDIPADISSAAFFLVGASIAAGSDLLLQHVGINPTRIGVINILQAMGADITFTNMKNVGGEPVADIQVRSRPLHGITVPKDQVPLAIDEFPALCIAAACAQGSTVITGAEELRVKESDRIAVVAEGLTRLGISVQTHNDGMVIHGGTMHAGTVDSYGDHRIAMAFAMAALRTNGPLRILNCANVNTSFPNFVTIAAQSGLTINIE